MNTYIQDCDFNSIVSTISNKVIEVQHIQSKRRSKLKEGTTKFNMKMKSKIAQLIDPIIDSIQ